MKKNNDFKTHKSHSPIAFSAMAVLLFCISSLSCKAEATLQAQKDGSIQIAFSGSCGKYFENMLRSFSNGNSNAPLFDATELKKSFISDGFKNVDVKTPNKVGISVKMTDNGNSFLFKSGLLVCDKKNVYVNLSPEILKKVYSVADEQTSMILDLFIAPVFNDEKMSEEEYLETVGAFYGNEATTEITDCDLKLTLISVDGKKNEIKLPLVKLLTLQEAISF